MQPNSVPCHHRGFCQRGSPCPSPAVLPLALILFDIDGFKQINDRFGHLEGDRIIAQVGQILKASLRETDLVCRWGGEGFLLLLKGGPLVTAEGVAEKIRQAIQQHSFTAAGQELAVLISAGVTAVAAGDTAEAAIGRADAAMYRAKAAGRNRVMALSATD